MPQYHGARSSGLLAHQAQWARPTLARVLQRLSLPLAVVVPDWPGKASFAPALAASSTAITSCLHPRCYALAPTAHSPLRLGEAGCSTSVPPAGGSLLLRIGAQLQPQPSSPALAHWPALKPPLDLVDPLWPSPRPALMTESGADFLPIVAPIWSPAVYTIFCFLGSLFDSNGIAGVSLGQYVAPMALKHNVAGYFPLPTKSLLMLAVRDGLARLDRARGGHAPASCLPPPAVAAWNTLQRCLSQPLSPTFSEDAQVAN